MIIPIWMADWEHECCGPEVKIGDRVECRVYAYVDDSLKTTAEEYHILTASDDEVILRNLYRSWSAGGKSWALSQVAQLRLVEGLKRFEA